MNIKKLSILLTSVILLSLTTIISCSKEDEENNSKLEIANEGQLNQTAFADELTK